MSELALHELLRTACTTCDNVVIVGDFNHRTTDWTRLQAEAEGRRFMDLTQDLFLTQHVHNATRGENILDLVFFSEPNIVDNIRIREPFSDNIVICDIVVSIQTKEWRETYYDFKKATFLEKYDWKRAFQDTEAQIFTSSNLYITPQCNNLFLWQQGRGNPDG